MPDINKKRHLDDETSSPSIFNRARNRISADIMQHGWKGNAVKTRKNYKQYAKENPEHARDYYNLKYGEPMQYAYLSSPEEFNRIMLENGYFPGTEGDYGLVQKAVGKRTLPIYQQRKDEATRDTLVPIANPFIDDDNDEWYGQEGLRHAGSYPTTLYIDGLTGQYYQKGWDLNDYGGDTGAAKNRSLYGKLKGNILDLLGNPSVITTGFQKAKYSPYFDENVEEYLDEEYLKPYLQKQGLHLENIDGKKYVTLPELKVTDKRSLKNSGKLK